MHRLAADPHAQVESYTPVIPGPRATTTTLSTAATIGHYRRLPGAAAARAAQAARARWRTHRALDDLGYRHRITDRLFALLDGVDKGRHLAAVAADLHALADHCTAVQTRQDAELAAYADAHDAPPAEEPPA